MWHDPHVGYNPNLLIEEWEEFRRDERLLSISQDIKQILDDGKMAVVQSHVLCEITFDVFAQMAKPAILLQMDWTPHWSSWVIASLIGAQFEYEDMHGEGVTRFLKTNQSNEPYTPENTTFVEDEYRRQQPVLRSYQRKVEEKQYELFEF